ncbi:PREDICTED: basic proline-rich protein-like, partial [Chrysochloris asiatica]|uniref:Basic proline-rich protein-like n=1 Tax=Chrysochloris asiatica TaxID=185453 RepID=A0A9B0UAM3_CHRAS
KRPSLPPGSSRAQTPLSPRPSGVPRGGGGGGAPRGCGGGEEERRLSPPSSCLPRSPTLPGLHLSPPPLPAPAARQSRLTHAPRIVCLTDPRPLPRSSSAPAPHAPGSGPRVRRPPPRALAKPFFPGLALTSARRPAPRLSPGLKAPSPAAPPRSHFSPPPPSPPPGPSPLESGLQPGRGLSPLFASPPLPFPSDPTPVSPFPGRRREPGGKEAAPGTGESSRAEGRGGCRGRQGGGKGGGDGGEGASHNSSPGSRPRSRPRPGPPTALEGGGWLEEGDAQVLAARTGTQHCQGPI